MFSHRKAWILDVGHGASTIVEASGHITVIDGGRRDALLRFLDERCITRVDTVIVSHVDADHFGGISLLLLDSRFEVGHVYVNPDVRQTALWLDFISVMLDAKKRGANFNLELTNVNPCKLTNGEVQLEILGPSQEFATRTANGRLSDGRTLTPNAMSAVVRVGANGSPRILITSDIDQVGLENLLEHAKDIEADVLAFPHHGGLPRNSSPTIFTESLVKAAGAQLVVFSVGRSQYNLPRPEIIKTVLSCAEDVHIACTQLSVHCAKCLPEKASDLHTVFARGEAERACCAGTLEISLKRDFDCLPSPAAHIEFINQNAPTAMCRGIAATPL